MFPEEIAKKLCEQGYAFAKGDGVPRDMPKAIKLLERAATLGDPKAQNRLAMCYYSGEGKGDTRNEKESDAYSPPSGVPQDYTAAVVLYEKAALQGLAWAQYNLGLWYAGTTMEHPTVTYFHSTSSVIRMGMVYKAMTKRRGCGSVRQPNKAT